MATMPALIGFSLDYSNGILWSLGVTATIAYQNVSPPFETPGIVLAQSPSAGSTISGAVTLTVPGAFKFPGLGGISVFSQPALLLGNDDNP